MYNLSLCLCNSFIDDYRRLVVEGLCVKEKLFCSFLVSFVS